MDEKEGSTLALEIPLRRITALHLGFEDVFRHGEGRQPGLFGFEPLRVTYQRGGEGRTRYLFARFHHATLGWRTSDNPALHRRLVDALAAQAGAA